jgi:hypothetical protein
LDWGLFGEEVFGQSLQVVVPPHIVKPDYAEGGLPLSELEAKKAAGKPVDIHAGAELDALRHAAKVAREVRHRRPN